MSQFERLCIVVSVLTLIFQAISTLHPLMKDLLELSLHSTMNWRNLMTRENCKVAPNSMAERFGEYLNEARHRRGWSRQKLSDEIGLLSGEIVGPTIPTIQRWEAGERLPSQRYLILLCLLFNRAQESFGICGHAYDELTTVLEVERTSD